MDRAAPDGRVAIRAEGHQAASGLLLLFGDPGFMADPNSVPTLRYVWTNGRAATDEAINNPYLPGIVRSVVIRSGTPGSANGCASGATSGDFERAFGKPP